MRAIMRTKDAELTRRIAKSMAGLTGRAFGIFPVRNRTIFELRPIRQDTPLRELNGFRLLAKGLRRNQEIKR